MSFKSKKVPYLPLFVGTIFASGFLLFGYLSDSYSPKQSKNQETKESKECTNGICSYESFIYPLDNMEEYELFTKPNEKTTTNRTIQKEGFRTLAYFVDGKKTWFLIDINFKEKKWIWTTDYTEAFFYRFGEKIIIQKPSNVYQYPDISSKNTGVLNPQVIHEKGVLEPFHDAKLPSIKDRWMYVEVGEIKGWITDKNVALKQNMNGTVEISNPVPIYSDYGEDFKTNNELEKGRYPVSLKFGDWLMVDVKGEQVWINPSLDLKKFVSVNNKPYPFPFKKGAKLHHNTYMFPKTIHTLPSDMKLPVYSTIHNEFGFWSEVEYKGKRYWHFTSQVD